MTVSRLRQLTVALRFPIACGALLATCGASAFAQLTELSGRIANSSGNGIATATVSLRCAADPRKSRSTTSGSAGGYDFTSLAPCSYTIVVTAEGYVSPAATQIVVANESRQQMREDVSLARAGGALPSSEAAGPLANIAAPPAQSAAAPADRPAFQAAGIHGLIDPGGYSASVTAGAASSVLRDVSGVQRANAAAGETVPSLESCDAIERRVQFAQQHPEQWQSSAETGRLLLQRGDARAALPLLLQAAARAPASATEVPLDVAEAMILSGSFREALMKLDAIPPAQWGLRYHRLRARAEEGLGDFAAAIRDREAALQGAATEQDVFALAYEHLLAGHVDQAKLVLQDGLKQYPQSISLLVGMGAVEFFQHSFDAALRDLLQSARLDPADPRPYPLLSDVSRMPDVDTTGVRSALERHLATDPNDANACAALASFLLRHTAERPPANGSASTGVLRDPEALLRRALTLDPGLTQARSDLALLYHQEHKFNLEAAELARVAAESPSRDVQFRLGLAYRASGQPQLATRALEQAKNFQDPAPSDNSRLTALLSVAPPAQRSPALNKLCASTTQDDRKPTP